MHIRLLFASLLVLVSVSAVADFETIERAYEVSLSDLTVPVAATGTLLFKECSDCETRAIRMSDDTRFTVNGKQVELRIFRKAVFGVRDRRAIMVIVHHRLESDTITSLNVTL